MKLLCNVWCAALMATGALSSAMNKPLLKPHLPPWDIDWKDVNNHVWHLGSIAYECNGNRAFGSSGFNRSLDYVLTRTHSRYRSRFKASTQQFTHRFDGTNRISLHGPRGRSVEVKTLQYNTATPLPGGIKAPVVNTFVDEKRGSACFEDQWRGLNVTGKIALIKRGHCAIADKLKLAKQHGALAAIVYNQLHGDIPEASLGVENFGKLVPAGLVSLKVGHEWTKRLVAGKNFEAALLVDSVLEERKSWNYISETRKGDPNNVIMVGAHLDSVQGSAGINDNGSGVTALIELMISIQKYTGYKNKIRFAFWGGKENGMIGSLHYTSQLTAEEASKIRYYFNYDMIGSPKPTWAVLADNDADKVGAKHLLQHLTKQGRPAFYRKFDNSSDYVPFRMLGIPGSGIFTGAEESADPCHRKACDTKRHANSDAIYDSTKAAAFAMSMLALSLEDLPLRNSTRPDNSTAVAGSQKFRKWARMAQTTELYRTFGGANTRRV